MELVKEQRIYVKFCFIVRKTAAETHDMMREAYSDDACFTSLVKSTTGVFVNESNVDCRKLAPPSR
jgi:hypothetical protein